MVGSLSQQIEVPIYQNIMLMFLLLELFIDFH